MISRRVKHGCRQLPVSKGSYLSICPQDCAGDLLSTRRRVFEPPPLSPPTEQPTRRLARGQPAGRAPTLGQQARWPGGAWSRPTPTHIAARLQCVTFCFGRALLFITSRKIKDVTTPPNPGHPLQAVIGRESSPASADVGLQILGKPASITRRIPQCILLGNTSTDHL